MRTDKILIYTWMTILAITAAGLTISITAYMPDLLGYEVAHLRPSAYREMVAPGIYEWTKFGSFQAFREARWNGSLTFLFGLTIGSPFLSGALILWEGHTRAERLANTRRAAVEPGSISYFAGDHCEKPSFLLRVARIMCAVLCSLVGIVGFITPIVFFTDWATANDGSPNIVGMMMVGGLSLAMSLPFLLAGLMTYVGRTEAKRPPYQQGVFNKTETHFHEETEIFSDFMRMRI